MTIVSRRGFLVGLFSLLSVAQAQAAGILLLGSTLDFILGEDGAIMQDENGNSIAAG